MDSFNNPQLQLSYDFVHFTGRNIFLTGKAGTGKTNFLHNLKNISHKQMVVVAPTGVAAINAKGVTIHSFFNFLSGLKYRVLNLLQCYQKAGDSIKRKSILSGVWIYW